MEGGVLRMSLIARWKCNEDPAINGTTLSDSSDNGYDMTLSTGDGLTNKSITGKHDKAINFDGGSATTLPNGDFLRICTRSSKVVLLNMLLRKV
jgi:hypothetical protein